MCEGYGLPCVQQKGPVSAAPPTPEVACVQTKLTQNGGGLSVVFRNDTPGRTRRKNRHLCPEFFCAVCVRFDQPSAPAFAPPPLLMVVFTTPPRPLRQLYKTNQPARKPPRTQQISRQEPARLPLPDCLSLLPSVVVSSLEKSLVRKKEQQAGTRAPSRGSWEYLDPAPPAPETSVFRRWCPASCVFRQQKHWAFVRKPVPFCTQNRACCC